VALFAIKYAQKLNIKINKDLEFVSYANLPLINYMENIPAASVEQFPYLQGQKATDILMDLLHHQDKETNEQTAYYKIIIESQLIENKK
jgi:LacI family transcriptional regulator